MRIAVAGGTGWLGRLLVEELTANGDEVVVLARSTGVDLTAGTGLRERLDGVDTVVDVTNIATQRKTRAIEFFDAVASQLVTGARQAGVRHVVAISIVGCDRVDLGYYFGKRRQEEIVLRQDVPGTVVRVTQFHEFAAQMLAAKGPFVLAPKMLTQPIAAAEVATHLADLARQEPQGMAPELAGPDEQLWMQNMVRRLARTTGERRPVLRIGLPGAVGRQLTSGALVPDGPGPRGTQTFDQWLSRRATRRPRR